MTKYKVSISVLRDSRLNLLIQDYVSSNSKEGALVKLMRDNRDLLHEMDIAGRFLIDIKEHSDLMSLTDCI